MSLSNDDEDDFQSADEDGFDEDLKNLKDLNDLKKDVEITKKEIEQQLKPQSITDEEHKVVDKVDDNSSFSIEPEVRQTASHKLERSPSLSDIETQDSKQILDEGDDVDDDDDNEESIAERIRERNLKIARKFSAELARSVQASAPVPVKPEPPIGFRVDDIEYPDIPDSEKKARQPLAPPPTPALSSSFSAEEPSSPSTQDSPGTQYGWRVPMKPRTKQTPGTPPTTTVKESDANQARAALDRLSEKYTDADKSLFEKVAEDLKKVAIRSDDPPIASNSEQESSEGSGLPTLPSLSSLGQTFSGWNWNSASRILASASEVTSQVSSVLDSVVNAPRGAAPSQQTSTSGLTQQKDAADQIPIISTNSNQPDTTKASAMSASDAVSNDAFVDLTLNAMESLGKKAFGAMTHRDESGSLQIKGLGRPWEQLMNIKKPQVAPKEDDTHQHQAQTSVRPNIPAEPITRRVLDDDIPDKKSSVRRRVVNYDDSDKLD